MVCRGLWISCLSLLFPAVASSDEAPVAQLVHRLGDRKYANREAAQRELLRRGPKVLAELEGLPSPPDPEAVERLRQVRYELVGLRYRDQIVEMLGKAEGRLGGGNNPIYREMDQFLKTGQPHAGDQLVALVGDPQHRRHGLAVWAFSEHHRAMTPAQIAAYIQHRVEVKCLARRTYPEGVDATIRFEGQVKTMDDTWLIKSGFLGRASLYIDGNPSNRAFELQTGGLSAGTHRAQVGLRYKITLGRETLTGEYRSPEAEFEILPRERWDSLRTIPTDETRRRVAEFLSFADGGDERPQFPAARYEVDGKRYEFDGPILRLRDRLGVDLCFDVAVHEVRTGRVFQGEPIVKTRGYYAPHTLGISLQHKDAVEFAKQFRDPVKVRVVLRPSPALAWSAPAVVGYYAESVTSGELWMKVIPARDSNGPKAAR